jgi:L-lactate dehydrogenase
MKKCAIIGCGNVGSTIAYRLMISGLFSEILLIDINKKRSAGEADDISHGIPFNSPVEIRSADYKELDDAGIIIIAAGVSQRAEETRIDLLQRNAKVFSEIIKNVKVTCFNGIILVVSNPVDLLTYLTLAFSGFDRKKVIGSGTVLDTARLKQLMGDRLNVDARNVHTFIIGEHGDSELPVWSSANVSGIDVSAYCNECASDFNERELEDIFVQVRDAAYSIIDSKGATYYAIAEAVKRIVEAIIRDERAILPVSAYLSGEYGIKGICLGVPCVIGANGIENVLEIPLSETEEKRLLHSASVLQSTIDKLKITATV